VCDTTISYLSSCEGCCVLVVRAVRALLQVVCKLLILHGRRCRTAVVRMNTCLCIR
jgi:hypothetical protein